MIVEFQCEHFWNSSQSHQRIKSAFNSSEWNTIFRIKITDKSDYTFVFLWLNGVFVWLCAISVRKKKNSSQLKIWYVFLFDSQFAHEINSRKHFCCSNVVLCVVLSNLRQSEFFFFLPPNSEIFQSVSSVLKKIKAF